MNLNSRLLSIVAIISALGLSSCQFKKGSDDKTAPTQTTQGEPQQAQGPKDIFEAITTADQKAGIAFIETVDYKYINAFGEDGITPLNMALQLHRLDRMNALLKRGAHPLMANRGTNDSPYETALANKYPEIKELAAVVQSEKSKTAALITAGKFAEAQTYAESCFMALNISFAEQLNFVDLVYLNRKQNISTAVETLLTALPKADYPSSTVKNFWNLSFEIKSEPLLNQLISSNKIISADELTTMVAASPSNWKIISLKSLNKAGVYLTLKLASVEADYFTDLVENSEGKLLDTAEVKQNLTLFEKNSADKTFCTDCLKIVLTQQAVASNRLELIGILIDTSKGSDPLLLSKIIPKVTAGELKEILLKANSAVLRNQKDVFLTTFSDDELSDQSLEKAKIIKTAGLIAGPDESRALLYKVFKAKSNSKKNAQDVITLLHEDLANKNNYATLTAHEIQILASSEFFSLLKNQNSSTEMLSILASIYGRPFESILIKSADNKNYVELNVTFEYLTTQQAEAASPGNSIFMLVTKAAPFFEQRKKPIWFTLQGDSKATELTNFDILMLSILKSKAVTEAQVLKIIKIINPILNPNVKNIFALRDDFARTRADLEATEKVSSRSLYFNALMRTPLDSTTKYLISAFNSERPVNFSQLSDEDPQIFLPLLKNSEMANFKEALELFKDYLPQRNPRLYVALVSNQLNKYKDFLKGDLNADPLCIGSSPNESAITISYQKRINFWKILDEEQKQLQEICKNSKNLDESQVPRQLSQDRSDLGKFMRATMEEAKRQRKAKSDIYSRELANDAKWADMLKTLLAEMSSEQFNNLDFFGLIASDLPLEIYHQEANPLDSNFGIVDSHPRRINIPTNLEK